MSIASVKLFFSDTGQSISSFAQSNYKAAGKLLSQWQGHFVTQVKSNPQNLLGAVVVNIVAFLGLNALATLVDDALTKGLGLTSDHWFKVSVKNLMLAAAVSGGVLGVNLAVGLVTTRSVLIAITATAFVVRLLLSSPPLSPSASFVPCIPSDSACTRLF